MRNSIPFKKENQFATIIKKLSSDLRELKAQLASKNKGIDGSFTVSGHTFTIKDGNITNIT